MIGVLSAGAVGDHIGRRKVMLTAIVWFSVGMGLTALSTPSPCSASCASSPDWASA